MNIDKINQASKEQPLPLYPAGTDKQFLAVIALLETYTPEMAFTHMLTNFAALPPEYRNAIEGYYNLYPFWGSFNQLNQDYGVFKSKADTLANHVQDLLWLYRRLADHRSRFILYAMINNWLNFDFDSLGKAGETVFNEYFDPDIMVCGEDEVLVDLGACAGDTVDNYLNTYGPVYKRIYCYDITPVAIELMRNKFIVTGQLPNIELRQKGAGEKKDVMYIKEHSQTITANTLVSEGTQAVEIVTIDEDIEEPVTFIKMDIEGAEQAAVRGCLNHIAQDKPKLALSLYHNNEDIWKIPRMIDEICPGYTFYLRYYGNRILATELTLLAVHPDRS